MCPFSLEPSTSSWLMFAQNEIIIFEKTKIDTSFGSRSNSAKRKQSRFVKNFENKFEIKVNLMR